jgi:hypothetical protein
MSQSSLILVLAILAVPIIAIYATFFFVGSGFEDTDNTVPPAKTEPKPEQREVRHAA